MNRRAMFQRGFGVLAVSFLLCVAGAWSQTVRKPGPGPAKEHPVEADVRSAPTGDSVPALDPEPVNRPGTIPPGPRAKAGTDDPDFEVIRPWISSVVTLRWKVKKTDHRQLTTQTRAGVMVDPRGYIITFPFRIDDEVGVIDDELGIPRTDGGTPGSRPISALFFEGTECVARVVDSDNSHVTILKVDLPRPYPAIDLKRIRDAVDRERVFLVPQQLRERTLKGRITTTSASFGNGIPALVGCNIAVPEGETGSLLVSEQGDPLAVFSEFIGRKDSYALPLADAKKVIRARIAEDEEDQLRESVPRPQPIAEFDPMAAEFVPRPRIPSRVAVTPESAPLVSQLGAVESAAAQEAKLISRLQTGDEPVPRSQIDEHRRLLNDRLKAAFDLKVQLDEQRLKEFRARLERLERQIGQRKSIRDKIIQRRTAELINAADTDWDSPVRSEPAFDPLESAGPDTSFDSGYPPASRTPRRSDLPPSDEPPFVSTDSPPVARGGATLTVHLRLQDEQDATGDSKQDKSKQPDDLVADVTLTKKSLSAVPALTGKSLRYDSTQSRTDADPRDKDRVFDFLQPGYYALTVKLADGQSMTRTVVIRNDKPVELTVICPRSAAARNHTRFGASLPAEFRVPGVTRLVSCRIEAEPIRLDGHVWTPATAIGQRIVFDPATGNPTAITGSDANGPDTDLTEIEDEQRSDFLERRTGLSDVADLARMAGFGRHPGASNLPGTYRE